MKNLSIFLFLTFTSVLLSGQNPCNNAPGIATRADKTAKIKVFLDSQIEMDAPATGTYQWVKLVSTSSSTYYMNLSGETNFTFIIPVVTATDAGMYNCKVNGQFVSPDVELTVFSNSLAARNKDKQALIDLYNATGGANWDVDPGTPGVQPPNWMTPSVPLENWDGVTVLGCRVTELHLSQFGLAGPIPPTFQDMSELRVIEMGQNSVIGIFEMDKLENLVRVVLHNNKFTDLVTNSNLNFYPSLNYLNVAGNEMDKNNATLDMTGMVALERLDADHAVSTLFGFKYLIIPSGPPSGYYGNLKIMVINHNNLITDLDISNMPVLENLTAHYNQIPKLTTNSIPNYHNSLTYLLMSNNPLGAQPLDVSEMPNLESLQASSSQLQSIDWGTGSYNSLDYMNIASNNLSGVFDLSIMPNIRYCHIAHNKTISSITTAGIIYNRLTNFHIYDNNFLGGSLDISNMPALVYLDAQTIYLGNLVKSSATNAYPSIYRINLSNNGLQGSIDISNMTNITELNLAHNDLDDMVLGPLSSYTNFDKLYMNNNKFTFQDVDEVWNIGNSASVFTYNNQEDIPYIWNNNGGVPPQPQLLSTTPETMSNTSGAFVYEWYFNTSTLTSLPSSIQVTLAGQSTGNYHCEITHPMMTGLTLKSSPFNFTGASQPIAPPPPSTSPMKIVPFSYPGPVQIRNQVTLKYQVNKDNKPQNIEILDLSGSRVKKISSDAIQSDGERITVPMDVKTAGQYIINVTSTDGTSTTYKVLVKD